MAGSELLSPLLVLSVSESVLALCGGRTVGVDASILLYRYLLRAPGAAAALINGDPSLAVAAFKEVLNWMHKLPISWIFVFDGSCEGKAELSRRRQLKRKEAYTKFMVDEHDEHAAAKAAMRTLDGASSTPLWSGSLLLPLRDARTFPAAQVAQGVKAQHR